MLVFDITTSDYVEFCDNVQTETIGNYLVANITKGEPFLKTAIASMDGFTLNKSDTGSLLMYDQRILSKGEMTLFITMRSADGTPSEVTFTSCEQTKTVSVDNEWNDYEITLPVSGGDFYDFSICASKDICIAKYHTA